MLIQGVCVVHFTLSFQQCSLVCASVQAYCNVMFTHGDNAMMLQSTQPVFLITVGNIA